MPSRRRRVDVSPPGPNPEGRIPPARSAQEGGCTPDEHQEAERTADRPELMTTAHTEVDLWWERAQLTRLQPRFPRINFLRPRIGLSSEVDPWRCVARLCTRTRFQSWRTPLKRCARSAASAARRECAARPARTGCAARPYPRSVGSSASRTPSPSELQAITVAKIRSPGQTAREGRLKI